ncbi:hypothetical protein H310_03232 [Aphanomyces invadans]|uniref:ADP-ribosyl cyclase/cyclic ADP-ribose hydrolase n=1 Tax=Aphanomyces invadans TaxID=157072 RepID=A0A024UGS5_9STRA|nr:hypothetical protein H310_03232 [Aphanomyces invadans]ETW05469.1 hypothetical protein H310_03232 [Aphanomyces invadans]|eukprot:XP_008865246.1 hypothetical protein H310_03232 [Aphanomyces invadans]
MGAGLLSKPADVASVSYEAIRVAPSSEVAQWFENLGNEFHEYATATLSHGIDGPLLRSLGASDLPLVLESLGVTDPLHVRLVATFFQQFKTAQRAAERPEAVAVEHHTVKPSPRQNPMMTKQVPFRKTTLAMPSPHKHPPHSRNVRSKSEAFVSLPIPSSDYQAYFSYVVGPDENGHPIKDRVGAIHAALISKGVVVWFDSEKAVSSPKLIDQGLLHSSVVVVFLTRSYMNQVNGDGVLASCQYEFTMALRHQTMSHMVFCVLEEDMMRYDSLTGEFRELAGDAACMDFTDDSFLDEACNELAETITRLDATKDQFSQPNDVARWGVTALVRFLKQPTTPPELIDEILHALVMMSLQSRLADKMVTKGILPLLLTMIKLRHHNSMTDRGVELLLLNLKILARTNAVTRRKTTTLVHEMGLLPDFMDLLKDGPGATKENTAGMLRNMFCAGERMAALPDVTTSEHFKTCVATFLSMLVHGNVNQQYEAASALSAFAAHRDFQTLIVRANGIRICLAQVMQADLNECVRDHVAMILRFLSGTEGNQREIGAEGGVEAFLTLLESGSTCQRETSAGALNWLMECEDNRCILAGDGGVPTLLKFMKSDTTLFISQQAINALSKLAHHSHYHSDLAAAGALEPCLAVLETGVDGQKTAAAHILSAIASTDLIDGMIKAIPITVKLFHRGSTVQKRLAVDVLSKLCRRKQFKQTILNLGIPEGARSTCIQIHMLGSSRGTMVF